MTMISPRLVIFDLDGTLVDSVGDIHDAANAMLRRLGRAPVTVAQTRRMIGEGAARLVELTLLASPGEAIDLDEAVGIFLDAYESAPPRHTVLYPGVRRTLEGLKAAGLPLALCTNKPERPTRLVLDALGLAADFSAVVGGDTHAFRKPDPRMLTGLTEHFGVTPAEALLVGDSEVDAATAEAASLPFVLVTAGYRKGPAEAIPAIARIPRMDDLLTLLA